LIHKGYKIAVKVIDLLETDEAGNIPAGTNIHPVTLVKGQRILPITADHTPVIGKHPDADRRSFGKHNRASD
jgi:hypothetical protein